MSIVILTIFHLFLSRYLGAFLFAMGKTEDYYGTMLQSPFFLLSVICHKKKSAISAQNIENRKKIKEKSVAQIIEHHIARGETLIWRSFHGNA